MRYEDFVVRIEPHHEHGYVVQVVRSPAGEAASPFLWPFPDDDVENVLRGLSSVVTRDRRLPDRHLHVTEVVDTQHFTPQKVGEELGRSLFSGEVLSCLDQSIGATVKDQRSGLRIKLRFDLADPVIASLSRLPWELLSRPGDEPLALHRQTPVVRYLEVKRPAMPLPLPRPLRILVVMATAGEPLDLERECRELRAVWGGIPQVEVHFEGAHLDSVRQALLRYGCHVLHYMGHGLFDHTKGRGLLPFAGDDGRTQEVSAELLATQLGGTGLRLVFLNACNTARAWSEADHNPYNGIAAALVKNGLPAVVAMQQPISDRAAVLFSKSFYQSLAAGDPIDTATTEGRLALYRSPHAPEWSIPVLFMRVEDGRLFLPRRRRSAKAAAVAAIALLVAVVVSLAVLTGVPGSSTPEVVDRAREGDELAPAAQARARGVAVAAAVRGQSVGLTEPGPNDLGRLFEDPESIMTPEPSCSSGLPEGCIPADWCCKICSSSRACGDSCIRFGYTCHQPPGCACNSWEVCGQALLAGVSVDPTVNHIGTGIR